MIHRLYSIAHGEFIYNFKCRFIEINFPWITLKLIKKNTYIPNEFKSFDHNYCKIIFRSLLNLNVVSLTVSLNCNTGIFTNLSCFQQALTKKKILCSLLQYRLKINNKGTISMIPDKQDLVKHLRWSFLTKIVNF